ncbi:MAG: metal-binding protein ZinT [Paracoccus sp. (in: a-proteobacteria)]|nr:metal-binding protein ZinT [Paracoccus sp. (in: a-proteobacteria)]
MPPIHKAALAAALAGLLAGPALAHGSHSHDDKHEDSQPETETETGAGTPRGGVAQGYFEDSQIAARALTDWEGDWQSVYPYLLDGALDVVMAHKAEHGDKTAQEYRAYYETGYATDVDRIVIKDDFVTFFQDGQPVTGRYTDDGYEVLTYAQGNRGVRFVFRKTEGQPEAPDYIQFSDHIIAPEKSHHFHLYRGDDRAALLEEVTNWPTYYPAALRAGEIAHEMIAH